MQAPFWRWLKKLSKDLLTNTSDGDLSPNCSLVCNHSLTVLVVTVVVVGIGNAMGGEGSQEL